MNNTELTYTFNSNNSLEGWTNLLYKLKGCPCCSIIIEKRKVIESKYTNYCLTGTTVKIKLFVKHGP